MKIVVAGVSWWGGFMDYCVRALRDFGNDVVVVDMFVPQRDSAAERPERYVESRVLRLLPRLRGITWRLEAVRDHRRRFLLEQEVREANRRLVSVCEQVSPDIIIVFLVLNDVIRPETLQDLRRRTGGKRIPILGWVINNPLLRKEASLCLEWLDYVFVYDRFLISSLRRLTDAPVEYLPNAGDPRVFRPVELSSGELERYGSELGFVGAGYGDGGGVTRARILSRLATDLNGDGLVDDADLKVFGDHGWSRLLAHFPELAPHLKTGVLPVDEANKVFNASRISLNIHHQQVLSGTRTTTFEIPLAGGFQVTERKSDLGHLFDLRDEIVSFETIGELEALVKHYLSNETDRRSIADRARKRVLKEHTFAHRIDHIMAVARSM